MTIWFCESLCTWTSSWGSSTDFFRLGGTLVCRIGSGPESGGMELECAVVTARARSSALCASGGVAELARTRSMLMASSGSERGKCWMRFPRRNRALLQQLQHELLLLVGLGQRRNAGLFQDGVFGQVGHGGWNVGRGDAVHRSRQVLGLAADDGTCAL